MILVCDLVTSTQWCSARWSETCIDNPPCNWHIFCNNFQQLLVYIYATKYSTHFSPQQLMSVQLVQWGPLHMHVYFPEKYHNPMLYCRVVMEIGVATKLTSTTLFFSNFHENRWDDQNNHWDLLKFSFCGTSRQDVWYYDGRVAVTIVWSVKAPTYGKTESFVWWLSENTRKGTTWIFWNFRVVKTNQKITGLFDLLARFHKRTFNDISW